MTSKVLNPIEIKEEYEKTPSFRILSKKYNTTCRNIRKHLLLGGGAINFKKGTTINYKANNGSFKLGSTSWNKGISMSETFCKMRSENMKQQVLDGTFYYPSKHSEVAEKISLGKLGDKNPMFGKVGPLSVNWQGGKSFEVYPIEFSKKLKHCIRKRDGFTCQICKRHQSLFKTKLSIHHIDYNKKNCNESNLISLCIDCHTKTNFNRDYWYKICINLMETIK